VERAPVHRGRLHPISCHQSAWRLFHILSCAALAHHFVQEILDNHEQKQHLTLLPARHSREHLQQLRIDLLSEPQMAVGKVRHSF